MLMFDAVIYNEDRHFGNFGILRDNRNGRILGPAPFFDNGLSLFSYAMPDDIRNLAEYAKTRANPYGVSFEAICREVMGTKQRNQLRRRRRRKRRYNQGKNRIGGFNHILVKTSYLVFCGL